MNTMYTVIKSRSMDNKLSQEGKRQEEKVNKKERVRLLPTPGKWGYPVRANRIERFTLSQSQYADSLSNVMI